MNFSLPSAAANGRYNAARTRRGKNFHRRGQGAPPENSRRALWLTADFCGGTKAAQV